MQKQKKKPKRIISTCVRKKCQQDKATDDRLFCEECRKEWKVLCLASGIDQQNITEEEKQEILDVFIDS